jgi:hypothetical protein
LKKDRVEAPVGREHGRVGDGEGTRRVLLAGLCDHRLAPVGTEDVSTAVRVVGFLPTRSDAVGAFGRQVARPTAEVQNVFAQLGVEEVDDVAAVLVHVGEVVLVAGGVPRLVGVGRGGVVRVVHRRCLAGPPGNRSYSPAKPARKAVIARPAAHATAMATSAANRSVP